MAHHLVTCPVIVRNPSLTAPMWWITAPHIHIPPTSPCLKLDVGFRLYLPCVRFCEKDDNNEGGDCDENVAFIRVNHQTGGMPNAK